MRDYLRLIDTTTRGRYDVTPLFADHAAFVALVEDLAAPFAGVDVGLVAGIDALGFILGTAMAQRLLTGFVPVRKGGKLPGPTDAAQFTDYSGQEKRLEIRMDAIPLAARVLIVDEWIETGAQVAAAIRLIEGRGGIVVGVATIGMDHAATCPLTELYLTHALWTEN